MRGCKRQVYVSLFSQRAASGAFGLLWVAGVWEGHGVNCYLVSGKDVLVSQLQLECESYSLTQHNGFQPSTSCYAGKWKCLSKELTSGLAK